MHITEVLSRHDSYQGKIQTPAGILVVDNNRRMVSLNRKFIDMWCVPEHVIVSQDEEQALKLASTLVEDTKSFLSCIETIYTKNTDLEIHDTVKLRDGRMFERHSQPQYLEEKRVGRIWKFYEINRA